VISKIRVTDWLGRVTDFEANPVWVKDLRQAARSRIVPGLLVLMILGFYAISAITLFIGERDGFQNSHTGQPLFEAVSLLLMAVSFIFIPVYCFCRTFAERMDSEADLFYITSMSPKQIMAGKSLSVMHLALLFYATSLPFVCMSYLLRGVDFPSILLMLLFLFSLNMLLAIGAIILGLQSWDIVPKIAISAAVGTTTLLTCLSRISDLIQGDVFSSMLETPWESGFVWKAGLYILLWCFTYKVLTLHGTHLIQKIASMGPQPLLRFSMTPRPQRRKTRKRRAYNSTPSEDPSTSGDSRASAIRQIGERLVSTLQESQIQADSSHRTANPIWHKEYTQATRNPYIVGILLLLLCVFYVTTCFIVYYNPNMYLGNVVFYSISRIITLTSTLFIPVYFFARLLGEEISRQRELVLISELTAGEIVRGKFLNALHIILLFFLVASPFIVATNLFHGIDLHTIFLKLESSFIASLLLTTGAITLGLSPLSVSAKTIVCACAVLALLFVPRYLDVPQEAPIYAALPDMKNWPTWIRLSAYPFSTALLVGFFYYWAKAFLMPSALNRTLPFRRYTTLMILLFNVEIAVFSWIGNDFAYLNHAIYLNALVVKIGILIILCGKDRLLGTRIRRELPPPLYKRILIFPFFKGRFPGMLWILGLWLTSSAMLIAFAYMWKGRNQYPTVEIDALLYLSLGMGIFVMYCFSFGLIARAIQHYVLKGSSTWTGGSIYLAFLTFPSIIMETCRQQGWLLGGESIPGVILSLRVAMLSQDFTTLSPHFYYSLILTVTGLILNSKWIYWQMRRFSPVPN